MPYREPARARARQIRSTLVAAVLVVSVGLVGLVAYRSMVSSQPSAASPSSAGSQASAGSTSDTRLRPTLRTPDQAPPKKAKPSKADRGKEAGEVPDGVTVFDDELPGVTNLDPDLLSALREAATDAADDGVEFFVNSGWRSPEYQERLLREAVEKYGSKKEAARWVSTPDTSLHVSGDAADIGHSDATKWLSKHGAEYGLCQIYDNEPWHYELRAGAVDDGCPSRYADPTQDPRMRN